MTHPNFTVTTLGKKKKNLKIQYVVVQQYSRYPVTLHPLSFFVQMQ